MERQTLRILENQTYIPIPCTCAVCTYEVYEVQYKPCPTFLKLVPDYSQRRTEMPWIFKIQIRTMVISIHPLLHLPSNWLSFSIAPSLLESFFHPACATTIHNHRVSHLFKDRLGSASAAPTSSEHNEGSALVRHFRQKLVGGLVSPSIPRQH